MGFRLAWLLSAVSEELNHVCNATLLNVASWIYSPRTSIEGGPARETNSFGINRGACWGGSVKLSSPFHLTYICLRCFWVVASFTATRQGGWVGGWRWGDLWSTVLGGKCEGTHREQLILDIRTRGTHRERHLVTEMEKARLSPFSLNTLFQHLHAGKQENTSFFCCILTLPF